MAQTPYFPHSSLSVFPPFQTVFPQPSDAFDTVWAWFSPNILLKLTTLTPKKFIANWIVNNGDDSISLKANSTDITIRDCVFYRGLGVALGSIGQYVGEFETIERVRVSGIQFYQTLHAVSRFPSEGLRSSTNSQQGIFQNMDWRTSRLPAKRRRGRSWL